MFTTIQKITPCMQGPQRSFEQELICRQAYFWNQIYDTEVQDHPPLWGLLYRCFWLVVEGW